jgi:hypothetical protein
MPLWHVLCFGMPCAKNDGYCWPTSKCRKLCLAYAVVEGSETWSIRSRNSTRVAWKEDGQQYPEGKWTIPLLDIAVAEAETVVQPDTMPDDLTREPVVKERERQPVILLSS